MGKIAFVFPGQGAQYVGMGKEIIDNYPESKRIFDQANKILDFDLEEICFSEQELINITEYTQPALLTISIATLKAIEEMGVKADYVAGLSLGEYTALVANGCIDFESAVYIVRKRGQLMEEAAKKTKGTMAAVMGSDRETIQNVCKETPGIVDIANYNSPAQMVIAGETEAVLSVNEKLISKGIRVIPLKVSGAFHSPLMDEAAERLKDVLDEISFNPFTVPYTTNVTGEFVYNKDDVKALLIQQVKGSVKWEDCIHTLISQGVDTFIEIGPGKTLSGLIKKIDRTKKIINVENLETLARLKNELEV